jgi:branched-subunit amino acid transport protein
MTTWVRILCGFVGLIIQVVVLDAAIRTFLLPRVANVPFSRYTALVIRKIFWFIAGHKSYLTKDRILSLYASIVLLTYQALWLGFSVVAFAFFFIAAGTPHFSQAFEISGSSLFTLGIVAIHHGAVSVLEYIEAALGLTLLALLIAFIGPLYQAFQRREYAVSRLTVRAGIPATPWGVLEIAQSVESYDRLDELWREWEQWFIDVGETHTTLPILNFYRSPTPTQTWIGCAATVLDAAALFNAAVDAKPSPTAGLCIRAGWLTLRRIGDYFKVPYPTELTNDIPISLTREQFEIVLGRLELVGVPILADHDAAWSDFVGWRVNYDVLIERFYILFTCPRSDWLTAAVQPLVGPSNKRA